MAVLGRSAVALFAVFLATACARHPRLLNLQPVSSRSAASVPTRDEKTKQTVDTVDRTGKRAEQNSHPHGRPPGERIVDGGDDDAAQPASTSGTVLPAAPISWSVIESRRPDSVSHQQPATAAAHSLADSHGTTNASRVWAAVIACALIAGILWLPRRVR